MMDYLKILNSFSEELNSLTTLKCLKYGHIVVMLKQLRHSQPILEKVKQVFMTLPEKFSSRLLESDIEEIWQEYQKKNKSVKRRHIRVQMIAFLDIELVDLTLFDFPDRQASQPQLSRQSLQCQTELSRQSLQCQTELSAETSQSQTQLSLQPSQYQTQLSLQPLQYQTQLSLQPLQCQPQLSRQSLQCQPQLSRQSLQCQTELSAETSQSQKQLSLQPSQSQTQLDVESPQTQTQLSLQPLQYQTQLSLQPLQYQTQLSLQPLQYLKLQPVETNQQLVETLAMKQAVAGLSTLKQPVAGLSTLKQPVAGISTLKQPVAGLSTKTKLLKQSLTLANTQPAEPQHSKLSAKSSQLKSKSGKHSTNLSNQLIQLNFKYKHIQLKTSKLIKKNLSLVSESAKIENKLEKARKACNKQKKMYKRVYSKMRRAENRNLPLKQKLAETKRQLIQVVHSNSKIQQAAATNRAIELAYIQQISKLKKQNSALKLELQDQEVAMDELQEALRLQEISQNSKTRAVVETKENGKYQEKIRKAVYLCARLRVPARFISNLIEEISLLLFDISFSSMPSVSSVLNMIAEMRLLSMVQAVEAILKSTFVNLAWDATTVKWKHLNEVHVNTESGHFVLDVTVVAGSQASDYSEHIISALENAVDCYCSFNTNCDRLDVLSKVKENITSTLSDRAAVNSCVTAKLEQYVGHSLMELNCNIHPLDSLSIEYRKLAKSYELKQNVSSTLPGNESVLLKLILSISKMKRKNSSGEPNKFKAFFDYQKEDHRLIMRYVGNRFHVLFALCGNIHYLLKLLIMYFSDVSEKEISKGILSALQSDVVRQELLIGGLFGKRLTGPWMTCLYRKENVSNLESSRILNQAYKNVQKLVQEPELLWSKDFNCFNIANSEDPVALHLNAVEPDHALLSLASQTAKSFEQVMVRQLTRYLQGGELYELPPERVVLATNAPSDNMIGESILGMSDSLCRNLHNSTAAHLSAKVAFATNKTFEWLDTLEIGSISNLIKASRTLQSTSKYQATQVSEDISGRIQIKLQSQIDKKRRLLSSTIKSFTQVPSSFEENVANQNLDIPVSVVNTAADIVRCPDTLVGQEFVHIWNVDGRDRKYRLRVIDCKSAADVTKYTSVCIEEGECFSEAEEYDFMLHNFLTDFLVGDAYFEDSHGSAGMENSEGEIINKESCSLLRV